MKQTYPGYQTSRRLKMSRKSTFLALAAVASLGIAFSSTSASAFGGHGLGHGPGLGGMRVGGIGGARLIAPPLPPGPCTTLPRVLTPPPPPPPHHHSTPTPTS